MIERLEIDWWKSSHLYFHDDGPVSKGAKTRQFSVLSSSNKSLLGYVKWFSHWRKYCFYPLNSLFDDQCLEEVAQFMWEATDAHMGRLPNIKRTKALEQRRRQRRIEQLTNRKKKSTMVSEIKKEGPASDVVGLVEGGGLAPEVQGEL